MIWQTTFWVKTHQKKRKKLTTEIVEAKIFILEKILNCFKFFLDAKNCKYEIFNSRSMLRSMLL